MSLLALLLLADTTRPIQVMVAPGEVVRVTSVGTGEPVVFVPGLFGAAYGFRNVIPTLDAARYESIVVEPLGIGASGRPERADYSLTAQADRIAAVLDTLHVTRAIIVAHAVGASMVYRLAYRRPDLVRGLVSLDGGPVETASTPGFRRFMRFAPWIKWFGGVGLIRRKIRHALIVASGDTSWIDAAALDAYTAGAATDLNGTIKAYLSMTRAREAERLEPHLVQIRCPVLLLIGTAHHDGGITPSEVISLRSRLHAFTIETVPAAGLFLQEERPDVVAAAVRRMVAQN
jgi:pimeloyl-ACP methyl ester carboxylesterase